MRIEFLGTGGYHPNERRHTACVMLPEAGILFDAGTSAFRIPARLRTDSLKVFLSHAHLDHIAGLTYLLVPVIRGTLRDVTVYGTAEVLNAVETHLFAKPVFPVDPPFTMQPLPTAGEIHIGDSLIVSWTPLASHPGGSMAYRVDQSHGDGSAGVSVAYVTDTIVDGTYTEFIRGVDLLAHECYFTDENAELANQTGHSYSSTVAQLASDACVKRMVLLHVDPLNSGDDPVHLDQMRAIFANTELAEDGLVVEVNDA